MKQRIVITGANRGIGLALCQTYNRQGFEVIGVCRRSSSQLEDIADKVISGIDATSEANLQQLQEQLAGQPIHRLVNNAGLLHSESLGHIDYTTVEQQIKINAIAPLRVTETLLDQLADGSKVAMITSRMGSISDNGSGGYYGYRMSKAALNAASMSLARDLASRGVAVAILHPGFVQTDMVGHQGDITPNEAAERLFQRIENCNLSNSGTFWHSNGEILPW